MYTVFIQTYAKAAVTPPPANTKSGAKAGFERISEIKDMFSTMAIQ